jgi:glutamate decarboxylase
MLHEKNAVRDDLLDQVFASSDLSVAVPKYKMPEQEQDPRQLIRSWSTN